LANEKEGKPRATTEFEVQMDENDPRVRKEIENPLRMTTTTMGDYDDARAGTIREFTGDVDY